MSKSDAMADAEAERSLIGACLLSDAAIDVASAIVVPADFRVPRHQQLFAAIIEMREGGERVDVVTVAARFNEEGALNFLHELQNATPSISAAREYAHIIAGWALRRRLLVAGAAITDMAAGRTNADVEIGQIVEEARGLIADIDLPPGEVEPDSDIDQFVSDVDVNHQWLVPAFLEYRDRMLITATEGVGKSVFLRQTALCVASGFHPWTFERVEPRNVLYIDLENSARQVARGFQRLREIAGPDLAPHRLRVINKPNGINLTARSDKRWLIERCRANGTELLVIGPLYRMSSGVAERGDIGGEDQARSITAALDEVRIHCGVALLMETHAPHGTSQLGRDLRPFGSSVWLRWPEFGIGFRKTDPENDTIVDVEHWRGPRDEREWPRQLTRRGGRWMWSPTGGFYRR